MVGSVIVADEVVEEVPLVEVAALLEVVVVLLEDAVVQAQKVEPRLLL